MNIYDFTLEELENFLIENGFKKYNACSKASIREYSSSNK